MAALGTPAARATSSMVKTSSWGNMGRRDLKANPLPPMGCGFRPEPGHSGKLHILLSLPQVMADFTPFR
jgi:hypothetical protein